MVYYQVHMDHVEIEPVIKLSWIIFVLRMIRDLCCAQVALWNHVRIYLICYT